MVPNRAAHPGPLASQQSRFSSMNRRDRVEAAAILPGRAAAISIFISNRRHIMISDQDRSGSGRGGSSDSKRGFASMDEARQREIASKGGKAAHQKGTAHEFTSEEAREAGRKGGESRGRSSSSGGSTSSTHGGTAAPHAEAANQNHKRH